MLPKQPQLLLNFSFDPSLSQNFKQLWCFLLPFLTSLSPQGLAGIVSSTSHNMKQHTSAEVDGVIARICTKTESNFREEGTRGTFSGTN